MSLITSSPSSIFASLPLTSSATTTILLVTTIFGISYILILKRRKLPAPIIAGDETTYRHPPCLPTVPIFGSLPFLPAFPLQYKFFTKNMQKYGDVVAYYMMGQYKIILNSREAVHEAFVKRSTDFADRPRARVNNVLNPNQKGILFHGYDNNFKKYHKLSLGIMKQFGFGNRVMEKRIMEEMKYFMDHLASFNGCEFNPTPVVANCTMNIICGILFGKRFRDDDPDLSDTISNIRTSFNNLGKIFIVNVFPFLRLLFNFKLVRLLDAQKKIFKMLEEKIVECSAGLKYDSEGNVESPDVADKIENDDERDEKHLSSFIRSYIELEGVNYDREQLLHFMHELFLGGTETTASTIEWTLVLLANHQDIQEKMYRELESVLASRFQEAENKKHLLYCDAVFHEILRYKPVAPMTLPHQTMKDTHVMGYFIPQNTTVIGNLHGAHFDRRIWEEPDIFDPERFIDRSDETIKNKEHIVAFSLGKRSCFGEILARQEFFLSLTNLVWRFKILPPRDQQEVKVDDVMDVTAKPSPFKIRLLERN
ncbi:hypothetical protein HELRODRAFT_72409 [Helobdella robusta]|uniref:Cytochrome P450 n=1 Tax=Helobdella robusta TaxID=6412 RepID=T1G0Z5_HELRO|nr:hypothetical protein HELRODRAFT_72409 [Helobdella robusta]ESO10864.1 hypothetical protein HELRODRAFT_72409 [Helobdella robusta]